MRLHTRWWAHPRSRGENAASTAARKVSLGSSPLTRGKRRRNRIRGPHAGLIPAHAGKTTWSPRSSRPGRAHPRSRGENNNEPMVVMGGCGSSPLTRGKRSRPARSQDRSRLIPAHAGKTSTRLRAARRERAHPRSRGENIIGVVSARRPTGSSPLTRGKRGSVRALDALTGLIPAHAGKTLVSNGEIPKGRAHPRSRGENLAHDRHVCRPHGLIPAHAGKTRTSGAAGCRQRAHPRSRGENSITCAVRLARQGSSPLTRGKPHRLLDHAETPGLIPAHAGKTRLHYASRAMYRAHPRSRGENLPLILFLRPG